MYLLPPGWTEYNATSNFRLSDVEWPYPVQWRSVRLFLDSWGELTDEALLGPRLSSREPWPFET